MALTLEEKAAALGASAPFAGFTDTGKQIFAGLAQERLFPEGSPLFVEGAPGDALLVVVSGAVRLTQRRPGGEERVVGEAGPGDALGELAVLAPTVRQVTAVAAADCVALAVTHADFLALAPQKPQACLKLATAIAGLLSRRLADGRDALRDALARATPAA